MDQPTTHLEPLIPPHSRGVLWTIYFARFIDAVALSALIPLIPILAVSFGSPWTTSTWAASIAPLAIIVASPVMAFGTDRIGRRRMFQLAILMGLVANFLLYLLPGLIVFLLHRLLSGLSMTGAIPSAAVIGDVSSSSERGTLLSHRQAAYTLGLIAGPIVAAGFMLFAPTRVFLLLGALYALLFVAAVALPETRPNLSQTPKSEGAARQAWRSRPALALLVACCLQFTAVTTIMFSMTPLFIETLSSEAVTLPALIGGFLEPGRSAVVLASVAMAGYTVAAFAMQLTLSARVANRATSTHILAIVLLLFAATCLFLPSALAFGYETYVVLFLLTGAIAGLFLPSAMTALSLVGDRTKFSSLMGALEISIGVAAIVGPILAGPLSQAGPLAVFWTSALLTIGAAAACWMYSSSQRISSLQASRPKS